MDEEEGAEEAPSYEWMPSHMTADSLFFAAAIAQAAAEHLTLIATRAASSHNNVVDRKDFAASAALELETLTNPKE